MKLWFKSYFLVMFVLFFALSSLGESLTVLNEVPISDLLKRAEAGDVDAQYNAGLRYFWGNRGVEKDNDQAARWFQKASDQGHVEAQMNMGRMMVLGWGFPNDLDGGLALLRDASEKGSGGACWVLGDLFERGAHGVGRDLEKTEFWYQKGADLGHANSVTRLEKFRSAQGGGEAKREESISRSESAEIDLLKKNPPIKALDNLAGVSYEEAFRKLSLRIKEERLSGKDCEELGYIDNTGGKINVKNPFYSGHESQMSFENEYEGRRYQLDFRNNMQADLTAMRVQCRFFYTVERTWRVRGTRTEEKIKYLDSSFVCGVGANKKNQMETKPFVLNSWATPSGVYFSNGDAEVVEAKAEGVWVRVIYTTPDGQKLQRDFCDPDSLSSRINWNGQSI